jgi:hypothetical protein
MLADCDAKKMKKMTNKKEKDAKNLPHIHVPSLRECIWEKVCQLSSGLKLVVGGDRRVVGGLSP